MEYKKIKEYNKIIEETKNKLSLNGVVFAEKNEKCYVKIDNVSFFETEIKNKQDVIALSHKSYECGKNNAIINTINALQKLQKWLEGHEGTKFSFYSGHRKWPGIKVVWGKEKYNSNLEELTQIAEILEELNGGSSFSFVGIVKNSKLKLTSI